MKKFTAPKAIAPVTGTILSVDQLTSINGEFLAIKLMLRDRSTQSFSVSPTFASEFGFRSSLFVSNVVVVEAEDCIAGLTGFINESGSEEPHNFDHVAVTGITPLIEQFMVEDGYADRVIDSVMAKRAEVEAANAITTPTRAPKTFSNDDRIAKLLAQHDAISNPDVKANLMIKLVALGYKPAKTAKV